jgi:hypothetical protein
MSITKFLWLGILPAVLIVNAAEFPAPAVDSLAAAHKKRKRRFWPAAATGEWRPYSTG